MTVAASRPNSLYIDSATTKQRIKLVSKFLALPYSQQAPNAINLLQAQVPQEFESVWGREWGRMRNRITLAEANDSMSSARSVNWGSDCNRSQSCEMVTTLLYFPAGTSGTRALKHHRRPRTGNAKIFVPIICSLAPSPSVLTREWVAVMSTFGAWVELLSLHTDVSQTHMLTL